MRTLSCSKLQQKNVIINVVRVIDGSFLNKAVTKLFDLEISEYQEHEIK